MTACDINPVPRLQVAAMPVGSVLILGLEGELDQWTAKSVQWSSAIGEVSAETASGTLLLDLRRLYFMDLDGLASLTELANELEAHGRRLLIAGLRPRIREFLRNNASFSLTGERLSFEEALAQAQDWQARGSQAQGIASRGLPLEAAAQTAPSLAAA